MKEVRSNESAGNTPNAKILDKAFPENCKPATATDKAVTLNVSPTPAGVVSPAPDPGPAPQPGMSISGGSKAEAPHLGSLYGKGGTLKKP